MKRMLTLLVVMGCGLFASAAFGAEPAWNRAADTGDVAAFLGLQDHQYQALTAAEANEIRGTGGYYSHGLLNLNALANVKANVNVLGAVKVKANVNVHANVRVR